MSVTKSPENRALPVYKYQVCEYYSWQIDGEKTVETVADFIFLGFKITVDGDCSHEIKRRLLLGRKVMTNLSSVTQSCLTLYDPMNHSSPGLPVHHQLQEFIQTHLPQVGDAIKPSHPLSSPFPPRQHIKKQRHYFVNKGPSSQGCGFSSGHVWM